MIQDGLHSCEKWCLENSLKINARESKALILGSNFKVAGIDLGNEFSLNGQLLEYTNTYNYLGILLHRTVTLMP